MKNTHGLVGIPQSEVPQSLREGLADLLITHRPARVRLIARMLNSLAELAPYSPEMVQKIIDAEKKDNAEPADAKPSAEEVETREIALAGLQALIDLRPALSGWMDKVVASNMADDPEGKAEDACHCPECEERRARLKSEAIARPAGSVEPPADQSAT